MIQQNICTEAKISILNNISSLVDTAFDMNELMYLIIKVATKVTGARESSLLLLDKKKKKLNFFIASGESTQKLKKLEVNMGEGIAGWVAKEGKPTLISNIKDDPRWSRNIAKMVDFNICSIACAPMKINNEIIGVIEIIDKQDGGELNEEDMLLLQAFADMAASLLEKSKIYKSVKNENINLKNKIKEMLPVVGVSCAMQDIIKMSQKVAATSATVLISGESGTGKELIAKLIHNESLRKKGKMISLNCGALPEGMVERELFGHEKGSFTSAFSTQIGLFEAANKGTIFLDEIGEMHPGMQVKLLRVLQEGSFFRVGGTKAIATDVRVIAATNRTLEKLVEKNGFRKDLFYRLNVINIKVPSLRARREDIPFLIQHFLEEQKKNLNIPKLDMVKEAEDILVNYDWPGNVRELKNVVESAVIMRSNEREIRPNDLPITIPEKHYESSFVRLNLKEEMSKYKRNVINKALMMTKGRKTEAAKILNIGRTHLSKLLKDLEMG